MGGSWVLLLERYQVSKRQCQAMRAGDSNTSPDHKINSINGQCLYRPDLFSGCGQHENIFRLHNKIFDDLLLSQFFLYVEWPSGLHHQEI